MMRHNYTFKLIMVSSKFELSPRFLVVHTSIFLAPFVLYLNDAASDNTFTIHQSKVSYFIVGQTIKFTSCLLLGLNSNQFDHRDWLAMIDDLYINYYSSRAIVESMMVSHLFSSCVICAQCDDEEQSRDIVCTSQSR